MDSTNTKAILDKTFMLLDQAIIEKKAEQAAREQKRKSSRLKNELPTKAGNLPPAE
ncbi:MAG: hypothetical protein ACOYVJ_03970 [Nitrospirota bacterium]